MRTGQHCDREAAVEGVDIFQRILQTQIELSTGKRLLKALVRHGQVADIREALSAQQFVSDILRSDADTGGLYKPQRGNLGWPLRRQRRRRKNKSGGTGQ